MRRLILLSAFALASTLGIAAPLAAQATITTGAPTDHLGPLGKDSQFGTIPTAVAQTFVAPSGVGALDSFSFFYTGFINGGSLQLSASIYEFATDHLVGPALFTTGSINGTNSFNDEQLSVFAPNTVLDPLRTYALVLSAAQFYNASLDGSTIAIGTMANDAYAGGELFLSMATNQADLFNAGAFESGYATDAAFSAHFGAAPTTPNDPTDPSDPVTATPEPGSLLMLGTGLGALALAVRRRSTT